ncbi:MAG: hypothetical protein IT301_03585 [Dehalococcoidia bacterium]|nr:hypothetical protein [Dehalococcoidia bacterium]
MAVIALAVLASLGCDKSPDGYTVEELKALPVSSLVVPDGEVIRTTERPGTTLGGPTSTHIIVDVRTDLSAEEVFEFFRAELTELGWTFARTTAQQGRLLQASGRQGDFGIELVVLNRAVVRDDSDWGSRLTVYQLRVAAAGRKGE